MMNDAGGYSTVDWATISIIVGCLAPLVGVPLGIIAAYLRSIRDFQVNRFEEVEGRVRILDEAVQQVSEQMREIERDYTTKEEWLRESMHARQQLEKLTELVTRIQVEMENGNGLAHQFAEATRAMVHLTEVMVGRQEG